MPVPGGPPPAHGVQDAPPMGGTYSGGQAAREAAAARPRDIGELLAQALDAYRREAAGGEGAAQAAPGSEADVGELIAQALAAVTPGTGEANEEPSEGADSGGQGTERGVQETQARATDSGAVEPSGERAKVEGVEDWMWEWRGRRQVAPGEPCPAGLVYNMDLHAGTNCARLPDNVRARLDAVEAARGGGADERPLAPFPPWPDTPPAVIAAGDEEEEEQEAENKGDEEAYGPGESSWPSCTRTTPGPMSTPAWTWTRQMRRCCPCPPRCRPLPWGAVSSGTAGSMRPKVPTGTASRVRGGGRRGCGQALLSATSSSARGRAPRRRAWWQSPRTTARSGASNWGMRRSSITTPVMAGRLSRRKVSPCRCACRWGACSTRRGWRMCVGTAACTWPCGGVGLTLGVASRP